MTSNIKIKDWSAEERPREKMLLYGVKSLHNSELLAILLRSGDTHQTAVDLAKKLLASYHHSLTDLSKASYEELCQTKGIGTSKAASIMAAFELANRVSSETCEPLPQITCAYDAFQIMKPHFHHLLHEECWVMYLNRQNKMIHKECVSKGGTHSTIMDPKIIIKKGVDKLATGIILFHNHPSGNPHPGEEDRRQTKILRDASNMLDISLIDHIIISGNKYYSFSENSGI
jgi:DNA repair protein RadC